MSPEPPGSSWRSLIEGALEAMALSDDERVRLAEETFATAHDPTDGHPDLGPVTPAERAGLRAVGRFAWRALPAELGQQLLAKWRASGGLFTYSLILRVMSGDHVDLMNLGLGSSGGRSLLARFHIREELGPVEVGGRRYRAEERPSGDPVELWVARRDVCSDPARLPGLEAWLERTAAHDGPGVLTPREVLRATGGRIAVVLDAPGRPLAEVCRAAEPLALRVTAARGLLRAASTLVSGHGLVPYLFSDARVYAHGAVVVPLRPRVEPTESEDRHMGPRVDELLHQSPERVLGKQSSAGPRRDVYEVASVLFHLLEGRPPYEAPSVFLLLARKVKQPPDPPATLPPALQAVLLRGLTVDPAGRFADLDELEAALERALG